MIDDPPRENAMTPLKHRTVVVPVDFSDDTEDAIQAGADRVEDRGGLHVVHVAFPLDVRTHGLLPEEASDQARMEAARRRLVELAGRLAPGSQAVVLSGDAGLEVADYAGRVNADLIVVPSHGYHGLKRLLLGSTAERIIRHAPCSVLVLRRRDAE